MAVFLQNNCKFNNCGLIFPTLPELIHHIEDVHLDFDLADQLQRPSSLPISYILRTFGDNHTACGVRKDPPTMLSPASIRPIKRTCGSPAPSLSSATPTGSEMDEDNESESETSSDSWFQLGKEPSMSEFAKKMKPKDSKLEEDKPFLCTFSDCKRRYRNINGLKYHIRNTHNKKPPVANGNEAPVKEYPCDRCTRIYKTPHGLRQHKLTHDRPAMQSLQSTGPALGAGQAMKGIVVKTESSDPAITIDAVAAGVLAPDESLTAKPDVVIKPVLTNTINATTPTNNKNSNSETATVIEVKPTIPLPVLSGFMAGSPGLIPPTVLERSLENARTISAPTLQKHLLSPVVAKPASINLAATNGPL